MIKQNVIVTDSIDYKEDCVLCNHKLVPTQKVVLNNENCYFTQMPQEILIGSGLIIPKRHRANVFELTEEEWADTFDLLKKVKVYLDEKHQPDGYNVAWNTHSAAGQHLLHSHLHIIPRFNNEPLVGKDLLSFIGKPENKRALD